MSQAIEQKLTDPAFRKNLVSNPSGYAKELGFSDDNVEYIVVKNTKDNINFVLGNSDIMAAAIDDLEQINAAGRGLRMVGTPSGPAFEAWKSKWQLNWGTGGW